MANAYVDNVVPSIMAMMDLARQRPAYVAALATQPTQGHDFRAGDGDEVEVYRDRWIGDVALTKTARQVSETQPIGRPASTPLNKTIVKLRLTEYMGPVNVDQQAAPITITRRQMEYGRRNLWDGNIAGFTNAVGSQTLADDYQRWWDRAMIISELQRTTLARNPGGVADGSTTSSSKVGATDIKRTRNVLVSNNTPRFQDGYYHCLCNDLFLTHLTEDPDFKADQRAALTGQFFEGSQAQSITYLGTAPAISTPSGLPLFVPPQPVAYEGVLFWATNNLPNKTVNSLSTNLGYMFGPGSILQGTGGPGGQVQVRVHEDTDYQRLFSYIWATYAATQNPIDPAGNPNEGCIVEMRSMAL